MIDIKNYRILFGIILVIKFAKMLFIHIINVWNEFCYKNKQY